MVKIVRCNVVSERPQICVAGWIYVTVSNQIQAGKNDDTTTTMMMRGPGLSQIELSEDEQNNILELESSTATAYHQSPLSCPQNIVSPSCQS